MPKARDLTGFKFGKLIVIEKAENIGKETAWKCLCECGNYKIIRTGSLTCGRSKSCGCLKLEKSKYQGLSNTRLYKIWDGIKYRCYTKTCPNYHDYGGRGIRVCDEWLDSETGFINFYQWSVENNYQEGLSIDRINNNGNYEPNNCRWVTVKVQANNKRSNSYFEYNGKTQTVTEWADEYGIYVETLRKRLYAGWSIEDSLTVIVDSKEKNKLIEINGKNHTLIEWSDITGINLNTLRVRYSKGKRGSDLIKISKSMKLHKRKVD